MATIVGNDGAISVNSKAIASVKSFTVDIKADTIETTTMSAANDARTYVKGLSSFSGSADILWNDADWDNTPSGEVATWNPTDLSASNLVGASGVTAKFYLAKDYQGGTTDYVFTGDVIVTGYSIKSSVDGMVEASISFQGTGGVTYATGTAL